MKLLETIAYHISAANRRKKFALFLRQIRPTRSDTILDVGPNNKEFSASDNYLEKHYPFLPRITALSPVSLTQFHKRYPMVRTVRADACRLPFPENRFSVCHSNAVIEHVGSRDRQVEFLRELYRVSRKGFVTTPNRHFPIEIHTRLPLLHLLLPKRHFDWVARKLGKGWATGSYMTLLSKSDLAALLASAGIPEAKIFSQRFCGFPMTFAVVWEKPNR